MAALYQVAAPENYSARTHKVFRTIQKAERFMAKREGCRASLRLMDLSNTTRDVRDIYFVVSWNMAMVRNVRRWSYRPTRRRNKARVIWTRPAEA